MEFGSRRRAALEVERTRRQSWGGIDLIGYVRMTIVSLLVALLASACGMVRIEVGEEAEPSPDQEQTTATDHPSPLPEGWALCANGEAGFAIGFPSDWHSAGEPADPCTVFSREEIEVEPATEPPLTSMMVDAAEASVERVLEDLRGKGTELLDEQELEVAGHRAIRFEVEESEGRFYPEGTKRYGYVVGRQEGALIVQTVDAPRGDLPYEENKEIIDQAVQTIRFELA